MIELPPERAPDIDLVDAVDVVRVAGNQMDEIRAAPDGNRCRRMTRFSDYREL